MFKFEEVPSFYSEDFKTLHHDIGLVKRSNGLWDLWFGQDEISKDYEDNAYVDIIEGDIVSATEVHSLQVGIIISCLTSWNYLNRSGNPIYTEFGNKSYNLLKKNKGENTRYKIKQFFIECLNRMRRVYSIEYLNVYDVKTNPYVYKVIFKVLSVTNTIVDGEFYLNVDTLRSMSEIELNYNHPYTSVSNPLFIQCILKNEYGSFLEDELLYIYIKRDSDSDFKFRGITEPTDENGETYITVPPEGLNEHLQIMIVFKGNSIYNPCVSKIINIQSVGYYIKSRYTHKTVKDEDDEDVDVIDEHVLFVEDSTGNCLDTFRLGELLSDNIDISNVSLSEEIPIETIIANWNSKSNILKYDENNVLKGNESEKYKLYLIPSSTHIEGTNKLYYSAYAWNTDLSKLVLAFHDNVQLNTSNPNEVHFLIEDGKNGLFEIDFVDGHLYYHVELYDNEM